MNSQITKEANGFSIVHNKTQETYTTYLGIASGKLINLGDDALPSMAERGLIADNF